MIQQREMRSMDTPFKAWRAWAAAAHRERMRVRVFVARRLMRTCFGSWVTYVGDQRLAHASSEAYVMLQQRRLRSMVRFWQSWASDQPRVAALIQVFRKTVMFRAWRRVAVLNKAAASWRYHYSVRTVFGAWLKLYRDQQLVYRQRSSRDATSIRSLFRAWRVFSSRSHRLRMAATVLLEHSGGVPLGAQHRVPTVCLLPSQHVVLRAPAPAPAAWSGRPSSSRLPVIEDVTQIGDHSNTSVSVAPAEPVGGRGLVWQSLSSVHARVSGAVGDADGDQYWTQVEQTITSDPLKETSACLTIRQSTQLGSHSHHQAAETRSALRNRSVISIAPSGPFALVNPYRRSSAGNHRGDKSIPPMTPLAEQVLAMVPSATEFQPARLTVTVRELCEWEQGDLGVTIIISSAVLRWAMWRAWRLMYLLKTRHQLMVTPCRVHALQRLYAPVDPELPILV